jgi:hypothetical protein
MLPAWATVVLALGGAAIGALAALTASYLGYRSATLNLIHQEREAWTKALMEATGAFIDAWHELRWFLRARSVGAPQARVFDAEARERLDPLGTRCAQTVGMVIVLFGSDSEAGKAANEADSKIAELKEVVNRASIPWTEAARTEIESALAAASKAHEKFVREAHDAIRPAGRQG